MNNLYELAAGHTARFPNGNEPYQIVTRILEECGEVASEVNHFERSGIKIQKHGEPSKQHLADEIKQSLCALIQLAQYYGIEPELEMSVQNSIDRIHKERSGK
ncbi:MAG: MazG-like family protein [Ruminococcus sp.]|nr:MazG-like family protein [Ruminococcus sp.]